MARDARGSLGARARRHLRRNDTLGYLMAYLGDLHLRDAMPVAPGDPRVYFAAERTMLAWLRTGITVMAFGFVVARFGLFLRLLQAGGVPEIRHGLSPYLGAALVALGVVATVGGTVDYYRFIGTLPAADRPRSSSPHLLLGLSMGLVLIGAVLTVVLLI